MQRKYIKYLLYAFGTITLSCSGNLRLHAQPFLRKAVNPVRIIWQTSAKDSSILNSECLLKTGPAQAVVGAKVLCILKSTSQVHPGILFDFGKEIQGGIQIVTGWSSGRLRVRFGESVDEAMSEIGQKNSTNDHAIRDEIINLPMLGSQEFGNSGFRFVRIDMVDDDAKLILKDIHAISIYRNIPYVGSFHSSDSLLDAIWKTGAYTVQLNMQEYLWDGIKRDRLVWLGDMHPEISTIEAAFGYNEVVPKSLDFVRDNTPLPQYMNSTISYSMWWVLIQRDWYRHYGNLKYLKEQAGYLQELLRQLCGKIGSRGEETLDGGYRFLDWPTHDDSAAIHAGLQGLLVLTLEAGAELSCILKDEMTRGLCVTTISRLQKFTPDPANSKQAAAILSLAALQPADKMDSIIRIKGVERFSTFFGYYMLQAMAKAGNYEDALNDIRSYWGGMLKMGATTFWEDFDTSWMTGASRIDQLPDSGQKDIHGDYGGYCYVGYRKSLCHGWASGPTAWLTEHVLGITVQAIGCRVLKIEPHLGNLRFAEGTFPTPYGIVYVRHRRLADGRISSVIKVPKGVLVIR